jgi:hypothetical protein
MGGYKMSNRTFGVELEVADLNAEQVYLLLKMYDVPVNDPKSSRSRPEKWNLHHDGSIRDSNGHNDEEGRTVEVVSPILTGVAGLRQVKKVCALLKKAGGTVNTSCGLHVHVGANDLDIGEVMELLKLYSSNENVIDSFVHPSRRKNHNRYCESVSKTLSTIDFDAYKKRLEETNALFQVHLTKLENGTYQCYTCADNRRYWTRVNPNVPFVGGVQSCAECRESAKYYKQSIKDNLAIIEKGSWDSLAAIAQIANSRYRKVNLDSYNRHGTLEFRHHHGSIDGDVVCNWVKFVLNLVERARLNAKKRKNVKAGVLTGLPKNVKSFFVNRSNFTRNLWTDEIALAEGARYENSRDDRENEDETDECVF